MGDNQNPKFTIVFRQLQDTEHPIFRPRTLLVSTRYGTDRNFMVEHIGGGQYGIHKWLFINY